MRTRLPALAATAGLIALASLMPHASALAQASGKPFAKVGNWEVRQFKGYCVATAGFEGDRAFRIAAAGNGVSSFGFMGEGAAAFQKGKVSYRFSDNPNTFSRVAAPRQNPSEDGGAPWIVVTDPANEPSHAGDWATAKAITFSYRTGGQSVTERFDIRGIDKAWEKVWACSGG